MEMEQEEQDDSLENNWLYKEIREELREARREKYCLEGRLEVVREGIEFFTPIHFPRLVASVQTFMAEEKDLERLRELLIQLCIAKSEEEILNLIGREGKLKNSARA
jgi:hypothetical protein